MVKSLKIGISGVLSVGKTESIIKIIEMLNEEGIKVGGMLTEPIMEDNRQVGFQVMNWRTKEKAVLAHLHLDSSVVIDGYRVDIETLDEVGVKAIEDAIRKDDVIIVDEASKMQVESERFNTAVKAGLDANKPLILTFHKKSRNPLLQDVRRRDDIRIFELTDINKGILPHKVVELIVEDIKGGSF